MRQIDERLLKALALITAVITVISIILVFTEGCPITFRNIFSSIGAPFILVWFLLLWAGLKHNHTIRNKQNHLEEVNKDEK